MPPFRSRCADIDWKCCVANAPTLWYRTDHRLIASTSSVLESLEQERGMTEYQFHRWPSGSKRAPTPSVRLQAESHLHGGALALRHFKELGCDITAPLAHVDMSEPDGAKGSGKNN